MKILLILCCSIFLINACNTSQQKDILTNETESEVETAIDSSEVEPSLEAIWEYHYNQQSNEFELKQLRTVNGENLTAETVETILNKTWPKVQIEFNRISIDTAFISIPNSEILTQQMGSAGAMGFMITTTYTFTELQGIKYVSFDFVEGDHAMPGVYGRGAWVVKPL